MSYERDNEMLEYETEVEQPEPLGEIAPIPVQVCESVLTVPTIPQHANTYTIVLSTATNNGYGSGVDILLVQDPLRVKATVMTIDQPVVVSHSQTQANSSSNQAATVPNPSGAYLPITTPLVIATTQEMFVAATSATPTRISVIVERRSA